MLQAGANDLGGTLMEETISRMAGSTHGSAKTVEELTTISTTIGRPVKQRTTTYDAVRPSRCPGAVMTDAGQPPVDGGTTEEERLAADQLTCAT